MTDEELSAIEARASTPEPFTFNMTLPSCDHPERGHAPQCHNCRRADLEREIATRKPTFATHGRRDVLDLVTEVRRLRQRNEELTIERDCVSPDAAKKTARRFAMENDCPVSVYRGNEVAACNGRAKLVATVKPEEVRV
jgi:hypothetical protein